jgi:hypothetical protein
MSLDNNMKRNLIIGTAIVGVFGAIAYKKKMTMADVSKYARRIYGQKEDIQSLIVGAVAVYIAVTSADESNNIQQPTDEQSDVLTKEAS